MTADQNRAIKEGAVRLSIAHGQGGPEFWEMLIREVMKAFRSPADEIIRELDEAFSEVAQRRDHEDHGD